MHVLHYLPTIRSEIGGVVHGAVGVVSALVRHGCGVTVLTHDPTDAPESWASEKDLEVVHLGDPSGPLAMLRPTERATARAAMEKADVLHLHTPWKTGNLLLAREARSLGMSYVLSVHGMLSDWAMTQSSLKKRVYLALAGRRLIGDAAFVHFTTTCELESGRKWLYGAQGVVVPLPLDLEPFRSLPGPRLALEAFEAIRPRVPRVLLLSRLHVGKGVERLLDAVARLRDQGVECDVLIAGAGERPYVDSLHAHVRELGLGDRVHFLGHVDGELKVSLYQCADAFVLPTSHENFGLVLPEALACRTPVITTRGVGIWPELAKSGGASIVSATGAELAAAIRRLLEHEAKRREMGERGRKWVFDRLAPETVVPRYVDLYQRAIDTPRAPRR